MNTLNVKSDTANLIMPQLYEPQEDSELLKKHVPVYSKGLVLDMGTGTGIQAVEAAKTAEFVIGLDVNKDAVKYCEKNFKLEKTAFFKSNLFQFFEENFVYWDKADKKIEIYDKKKADKDKIKILSAKQIKFDLIIFNPPYLPRCREDPDTALDGGKAGFEALQRFFRSARKYLAKDGKIIIVFSSLTKPRKVFEIMGKAGFRYELLDSQHVFFEDLMVYLAE